MNSDRQQSSAKIYRFPVERRVRLRPVIEQADSSRTRVPEAAVVDVGGWYHDAAIEEARRSSKN